MERSPPAEEDSDLVCQPGIGWMDINAELKRRGIPLFFPVRLSPPLRPPPLFFFFLPLHCDVGSVQPFLGT